MYRLASTPRCLPTEAELARQTVPLNNNDVIMIFLIQQSCRFIKTRLIVSFVD